MSASRGDGSRSGGTDRAGLLRGSIVRYPYLWRREREAGETEGRKERPVCVVVAARRDATGETYLLLLAITSQPPGVHRNAVAIPDTERRRAGLDPDRPAWVIVDEANTDVLNRSFYLLPDPPVIGRFSQAFLASIAREVMVALRLPATRIDRTEP